MRGRTGAALATAILVVATTVQPMEGQQGAPAAARITLDEARTAVDAAVAEARRNGWNLAFVISDAEGTPIYLGRMDGVPKRNYDVAMNKVNTAITSGMHTAEYVAGVRAGTVKAIEGALPFEGGLLLRRGGQLVGAFSASGASGADDARAVRAGMAAIGIEATPTPGAAVASAPTPTPTAPAATAPAAAQAAVRVPVEVLDRYVGEYELGPDAFVVVRRKGDTLTGQPPGQPEFVLEPISQTRFNVRGTSVKLEVEFVTDAAGAMYKVLHQNGQEMRAPKRK
ncbi:MAG: heme-binding protein [Gemmatimonadales bacterium]|nr:heme-binding protein [Gemmatimonadales bacterium]